MGNFVVTVLKGLAVLAAVGVALALGLWLLGLAFAALGAVLSAVLACLPFVGMALAAGIVVALLWTVGKAISKR